MGNGRLRVLMIGPDRSVHGGISGVVNNYFDAGLNRKIDLRYIGTMVDGTKLRKLLQAAIAYVQFLILLPWYPIVHVHVASDSSYYRKSFFIKSAKRAGKRIVIHQHGGDFINFYHGQTFRRQQSIRRIFSKADAFLVLSPAWKDFFAGVIDEDKIIVFPNAVSDSGFVGKKYGQHKILLLGRLCAEKGIGELLSVIPAIKEKFPACQLYLAGVWEDNKLEKQAENLKECVTYLGWITGEEKQKYLKECDIYVLPSYFEGLPVSVLEAMSYACVIVASAVGGIPSMIEDGKTGILVEPKDAKSLRTGLEKVLSDPEMGKRMGSAAKQKVEKEFSMKTNMDRLMRLYKKLI